MKILALDTSSKILALGVYAEGRVYEYNLEVGRKLSDLLDKTIQRVLEAAGVGIKEIDYFACGIGPGSFTGVRTGVAMIKGLSWALKKPVIGISSLDILAQGAVDADKLIVPALDAKRSLIYCSVYQKKSGKLARVKPYMLLPENEVLAKIKGDYVLLGDAPLGSLNFLDKDYWYPKAHNIITLALERIKEKKIKNSFNLEPIYLYPKECQIKTK